MRPFSKKNVTEDEQNIREEYEEKDIEPETEQDSWFTRTRRFFFQFLLVIFFRNYSIVRKEFQLFLGIFFTVFGIFGFESGKYCDGNAAEYLSCTRPSTYYFYDWFHILLIAIGISCVVIWWLRKSK